MHRTAISTKGRVTIPARLQQAVRHQARYTHQLEGERGRLVLTPLTVTERKREDRGEKS